MATYEREMQSLRLYSDLKSRLADEADEYHIGISSLMTAILALHAGFECPEVKQYREWMREKSSSDLTLEELSESLASEQIALIDSPASAFPETQAVIARLGELNGALFEVREAYATAHKLDAYRAEIDSLCGRLADANKKVELWRDELEKSSRILKSLRETLYHIAGEDDSDA